MEVVKVPTLRHPRFYKHGAGTKDIEVQSDKVSMTVPDEAYSIRDLLARAVRNADLEVDIQVKFEGYDPSTNFDSEDLEAVIRMDLHERELFTDEVRAAVKLAREAVERDRLERAAKEKARVDEDEEIREVHRSSKKKPRQGEGDTGEHKPTPDERSKA